MKLFLTTSASGYFTSPPLLPPANCQEMMLKGLVASLAVAVVAVLAAPSFIGLPSRQIPNSYQPGCEGAPAGSSAFANGFSITALNTSLPNANSTGAALVVGIIAGGHGAEFYSLSVCTTHCIPRRY